MKKFLFVFTFLTLSVFMVNSVNAMNTEDPSCKVMSGSIDTYGYERTCIYEKNSDDMRVIFFSEEEQCLIVRGDNISFNYACILNTALPHEFIANDLKTLTAKTPGMLNYNASYPVYYYRDNTFSYGTSGIVDYYVNADITYSTEEEFWADLANYSSYADYISSNDKININDDKLPMLHYKLSQKNVVSFPNIIDKKISIDWDFSSLEPYASDPMAYAIEIIISANFYPNSEGQRICWDASNSAINQAGKRVLSGKRSLLEKPYSFIYFKEGDALYTSTNHIFATDELQDGYYLYIRSYSKNGTKSSNYKVYKCTTGGTSGQMDLTYDTEGNEYPLDESDRDEDSNYSNEYDEDSSSSADEDPTGDSYDGNGGYSFDTLYGNLNSMVNMLQGVPELWMHVMSWLPSWFPMFIVTMMGLLIVIGVLKYIF